MGDFNLNRIVWNPEPSVDACAPEILVIDCLQDIYYINMLLILLDSWRDRGQRVMTLY